MYWFAIYTKSRYEKKVALGLEKLGITTFCPMVKTIRTWSDRKKKVEVPLLPSYVFVKLEETDRNRVFEVPGVVQYLFWLKKPAIIKQHEIDTLKKVLDQTVTSFKIEKIQVGDEITVEEGFFVGKKGKVTSISKNKTTIILNDIGYKITFNYQGNEKDNA